jgi:membrane dipeptidase
MLVIDSHLDLAWNALQWNRDLLQSAHTLRTTESHVHGPGRARSTVAFPELRRGRVAVCFATLLARSTGRPMPHIDYGSWQQAQAIAKGQLAYYRTLESEGTVRIITGKEALEEQLREWRSWDERAAAGSEDAPPLGFVISMEGADPIARPEELESWHHAGLRLIGISHYGPCRYAGGTGTELGVNEAGRRLLAEMERLRIGLDLTHLTDQAFWQALDHYGGPVLASHNNCRALVPHQRQFSDDQLRAIFQRGGVIGAAFDAWMLEPGWQIGKTANERVTLENVVDHIDHVCQLAGNALHAAIGTDLDGGFGGDQSPRDLDTIADLQKLPAMLAKRGYRDADVEAVMHGNWERFLDGLWE